MAKVFPYEEFKLLLLEMLEKMEADSVPASTIDSGRQILSGVYHRVFELQDTAILKRVQRFLEPADSAFPAPKKPKTLKQLVEWLSSNPSSDFNYYVLKRVDKLIKASGEGASADEIIGNFFKTEYGKDLINIWLAPNRFGQKIPSMAFISIDLEIPNGKYLVGDSEISIEKFH
jgi:hypothetical protein